MSLVADLEAAIRGRLTSTAGTTLWGTRVWATQAPDRAARPYVVFQQITGGSENLTPNDSYDVHYQVECIAAEQAQAVSGAGYIQSAFPTQYVLTVSGFSNYSTFEEDWISRVDNIGGTAYWRRGQVYRIRLDRT